jgi:hypothetical protein
LPAGGAALRLCTPAVRIAAAGTLQLKTARDFPPHDTNVLFAFAALQTNRGQKNNSDINFL